MATYVPGVPQYLPEFKPFTPDYKFLSNVLDTKTNRYNTNYKQINDLYSSNLYINGGYFFSGNFILDYLKPNKEFVTDILPEVSKKNKVKVIKHEGFWHSLENYKDYLKIKKYFKHGI